MFGLFQTDIPIGRRLWVMILVFVLAGTSTNAVTSFSQDPILFAVNILIYFGYVDILSFGIAIIPGMIGQIIEKEIDWRRSKAKTYESVVRPQRSNTWFEILVNLSFVIATYISVSSFGSPQIIEVGLLGLSLLIVTEIFDINLLYTETPEFLELSHDVKGKLIARIINDNEQKFTLKSDFLTETRQLITHKWEIVDITRSKEKSTALLQRHTRKSRLGTIKSSTKRTKIKK